MDKKCQGCGAILHSGEADSPGFVPEHVLAADKPMICQRCYKIRHYGEDVLGSVASDKASQVVLEAANWAEGIIMVVDILDFEGSLSWDLIRSVKGKPLIAAVNKADLLPRKVSVGEAGNWIKKRFKELGVSAVPAVISSATGAGIPDFVNYLELLGHKRWLIAGASNTGKSTLVNRLLADQTSVQKATVSRFPGTTQETISWTHRRIGEFKDSPGLVPPGRLCDMLPQHEAAKLIPVQALRGKVYGFPTGAGMAIPGCAAVVSTAAPDDAVVVGFTASDVVWQRINASKVERWLQTDRGAVWRWKTVELQVKAGEEIIIHGLGSVAFRRQSNKVVLTLPEPVKFSLRPHLIGGKR